MTQFLNSLLHNLRLKNIVVGVKASGFLTTIVKNIQKTFQSTVPTLCDFSSWLFSSYIFCISCKTQTWYIAVKITGNELNTVVTLSEPCG